MTCMQIGHYSGEEGKIDEQGWRVYVIVSKRDERGSSISATNETTVF